MILLDTHAWVWWVGSPEMLSVPARKVIDQSAADNELHVSSMSSWEVAMLVKKGRLRLTMAVGTWIRKSERLPFLRFLPVDNTIVVKSVNLPGEFHDDPADRIIVATALSLNATLVTRDRKILDYPHVASLW